MDYKQELIRVTASYFEDIFDYQKLKATSKAYKTLLNAIIDTELDTADGRVNLLFNNGEAIATLWAASCLDDIIRTRQFIRGIDKVIKEKHETNENLHILYAGTGPFATLLLPILLRYPKAYFKYTLLEINPLSLKHVKHLISSLELEGYNITFVNQDATTYQLPQDTPDLIISETMQRALDKEQQVPIFYNLMRQAKPETVFIPEKIKLFIESQTKPITDQQIDSTKYVKHAQVFEVSKDNMRHVKDLKELSFPKLETTITKEALCDNPYLYLTTEIQIYKGEQLLLNESGLTIPKPIHYDTQTHHDDLAISTQYQISTDPKLAIEINSVAIT